MQLKDYTRDEIFIFNYSPDIDFRFFNHHITSYTLEDDFMEYYAYYEILYDTIEEFIFWLSRKWKKEILILYQLLQAYPQIITLEGDKVEHTETTNNLNEYSDTPNQSVTNTEAAYNYLTNRTLDKGTLNTSNLTTPNHHEQYAIIKETFENVIYNFLDKFRGLFKISLYE